jgi:hypothetical protein
MLEMQFRMIDNDVDFVAMPMVFGTTGPLPLTSGEIDVVGAPLPFTRSSEAIPAIMSVMYRCGKDRFRQNRSFSASVVGSTIDVL